MMDGVNFKQKLEQHQNALRTSEILIDEIISSSGWKCSCDYPGAYWLWSKSFPKKVKYKQECRGTARERRGLPKTLLGSRDMALEMEISWRRVFVSHDAVERYPETDGDDD